MMRPSSMIATSLARKRLSTHAGGPRRRFKRCPPIHVSSPAGASSSDVGKVAAAMDHRSSRVVDVTNLAQEIREPVRQYVRQCGETIRLLGVLAQQSPFRAYSELYSQHIHQNCVADGIDYELCRVIGGQPADLEEAIHRANARSDVHGILVYYPIFKTRMERGPYKNRRTGVYYKTHDDYLRDLVSSAKDVEGLSNDCYLRRLFRSGKQIAKTGLIFPCTAISVMNILEKYHLPSHDQRWEGITATILNRSDILGRPLAEMLASRGAAVYSLDEDSILLFRPGGRLRRCTDPRKDMAWCLGQSQVVVTAVPSHDFQIPCDYLQQGSTVVNVSEYQNAPDDKVLDVPETKLIPHVGRVTVAVLEQNLVLLHRRATGKNQFIQ